MLRPASLPDHFGPQHTGIWKSKGVNHTSAIIECGRAFLACAVGVSEGGLRGRNEGESKLERRFGGASW